ncbi:phosphoadenosine phosphosulfate reductase domain-containing protein [Desulfolucanica intricata]|uniref:phosphoadenosine phosphosulfate reductase domain-containing protein n=1 Tax=Desulfolucanica intricata TaxID=1285191 RepID=UPI0009EE0BD7
MGVRSYEEYLFKRGKFPLNQRPCCRSYLKTDPINKWLNRYADKDKDIIVTGERREESPFRLLYTEEYQHSSGLLGIRPVLNWTTFQVIDRIIRAGLNMNPLYNCFSRVSCWCCPNKKKWEWYQLKIHFPELFKKVCQWEEELGHTIKYGHTLTDWLKDIA